MYLGIFLNYYQRLLAISLLVFSPSLLKASHPFSGAIAVGMFGADESGYVMDVEKYLPWRWSGVVSGKSGQFHSQKTNEIFLGVRHFSDPSHFGHFLTLGVTHFMWPDQKSDLGYSVEFGGRFPIKTRFFVSVSTSLDYLVVDLAENVRATLGMRIGYQL
jgi:hypothetical protein